MRIALKKELSAEIENGKKLPPDLLVGWLGWWKCLNITQY